MKWDGREEAKLKKKKSKQTQASSLCCESKGKDICCHFPFEWANGISVYLHTFLHCLVFLYNFNFTSFPTSNPLN